MGQFSRRRSYGTLIEHPGNTMAIVEHEGPSPQFLGPGGFQEVFGPESTSREAKRRDMARLEPWENVYRAVHAIFSASGSHDWQQGWDYAVPTAIASLRERRERLTAEARQLTDELLTLVDRHQPHATSDAAKAHGRIGAAYRAMKPDSLIDFKWLLWALEEELRGEP